MEEKIKLNKENVVNLKEKSCNLTSSQEEVSSEVL